MYARYIFTGDVFTVSTLKKKRNNYIDKKEKKIKKLKLNNNL